jgi:ABC-type multidrug transport system fused ATPase/permease subunit
MRRLPEESPGSPDLRSPYRYIVWLARRQWQTIAGGTVFGVLWMVSQALVWGAVGAAIGQGAAKGSMSELVKWTAVVVGLGVVTALSGRMRHRFAVTNWLTATFRTIQLVGHHAADTGPALPASIPSGDVVNTVAADAGRVGGIFDVWARFIGAVVSWIVVACILLSTSLALGAIVLFGVPILMVLTAPMMKPLHASQAVQREAVGRLTALGADTVSGLRVLRGIGGEEVFLGRYKERSELVRLAGNRVAAPQALLESGQVLLPAVLVAAVTLLTARLAVRGTLGTQQMAAFYGYTAFLTMPLRTGIEAIIAVTRGVVGARKVLAVLAIPEATTETHTPAAPPPAGGDLFDPHSGFTAGAGRLTALVTETPEEAQAIADRLGRFTPPGASEWSEVTLSDIPVSTLALEDLRSRVVVSEIEPRLFSGPLRDELSPHAPDDETAILAALDVASAADVLDALPDGLDTVVEERGRSFSGGQRQRLALARVLLMDPEYLVLVEPTSAVDTHTEGRIAARLRNARGAHGTVVATTSPLLLEQADEVFYISGGCVVSRGRHEALLDGDPAYRALILRGNES